MSLTYVLQVGFDGSQGPEPYAPHFAGIGRVRERCAKADVTAEVFSDARVLLRDPVERVAEQLADTFADALTSRPSDSAFLDSADSTSNPRTA